MDVVIYVRWSSIEQGKGSSLQRQEGDCRRFAAARGWNVVDMIVDDGVSAFRGQNSLEGSLSRFVVDVEAGRHPPGIVLLVEKLDRLSRQNVRAVVSWVLRITELGVVICTVEDGRQYDAHNMDMVAMIEVAVKAGLGNLESERKSDRVGAAWAAKRERLQQGDRTVMTRRAPGWLAVEGSPPTFVVIKDRAETVRRIFEWTAAGLGKHLIARNLNLEGVAPFGRADGWHASYIQKILSSLAVLGEFQPGTKPKGGTRTTVGEPIAGYYPPIVDADLRARALASMADRSRIGMGRGRRLSNLFGGLAKCECGARMTFRAKGARVRANGDVVREDYLVCDAYQRGRGCRNANHYNYEIVERCVLDAVLAQAVEDRHFEAPAEARRIEIEIADRTRSLARIRERADNAMELAIESKRPEPRALYLRLVAEADAEESAIDLSRNQLVVARGAVSPAEHARRIEVLRGGMTSDDESERLAARMKIMGALHDLVTSMMFSRRSRLVGLELANDAYVVVHPYGEGITAGYVADRP
ncbi:recombinase family protein [Sphingomonas sp. CFBP 8760]|uniref:recombinase family protein n=1 Tax=Sphingomonas sp. CFBP 8760 TaxID=2775282 RepID=UPI00177E3E1A|nr:recombinase family protein [Sphingomonas sp. CFBP 8760]MBD8546011.1 recombinase family protein [Sphingomonas sp. CFBP 8760]